MSGDKDQLSIPKNSISCFIGRICEEPGDSFGEDGILWVDLTNINKEPDQRIEHGNSGSPELKAIASWTIRSAWIAWNKPPKVKFKGSAKLKGKISMSNAQISNVTISGGPPLQGNTTCGMGPGTAIIPVNISSASGSAKIEQSSDAEIEMETGDDLTIELIQQHSAQLPWCVANSEAEEGSDLDEEASFIQAGDKALCIALGNSMNNLYVIDLLK